MQDAGHTCANMHAQVLISVVLCSVVISLGLATVLISGRNLYKIGQHMLRKHRQKKTFERRSQSQLCLGSAPCSGASAPSGAASSSSGAEDGGAVAAAAGVARSSSGWLHNTRTTASE